MVTVGLFCVILTSRFRPARDGGRSRSRRRDTACPSRRASAPCSPPQTGHFSFTGHIPGDEIALGIALAAVELAALAAQVVSSSSRAALGARRVDVQSACACVLTAVRGSWDRPGTCRSGPSYRPSSRRTFRTATSETSILDFDLLDALLGLLQRLFKRDRRSRRCTLCHSRSPSSTSSSCSSMPAVNAISTISGKCSCIMVSLIDLAQLRGNQPLAFPA